MSKPVLQIVLGSTRPGRNGAAVALLDVNAEGCAALAAEIIAAGGRAAAIPCDVTDDASVAAAADQCAAINQAPYARRS